MRKPLAVLAAFMALGLSGCGYNTFQTTDEQVRAGWSEVVNPYQRRAVLIPNLVSTVKGEAKFEQDTLTKVIEARSKATSAQDCNVTVRSFPSNLTAMVMGYKEKPSFAVENEKEVFRPPSVGLETVPAKPASAASGAAR